MRPVIYLAVLPLAVVVGTLHTLAISHSFYWQFYWFDMPVHFCAGALVGLVVYLLARRYVSATKAFWSGFIGALVVGVCWEFFEYANGLSGVEPGFVLDTAKDLSMDITGSIVASFVAYKRDKSGIL